jgi:hypothetical protein
MCIEFGLKEELMFMGIYRRETEISRGIYFSWEKEIGFGRFQELRL